MNENKKVLFSTCALAKLLNQKGRRIFPAKVKRVFTALSPTLSTFTLESAKEKEENSSRTMIYGVRTRPDFDGREVD